MNLNKCKHLDDLLKAEMPAIKIAYMHRRLELSEFVEMKVSDKVAEKNFNDKYMRAFGEGYKLCYCYMVCPARDSCDIKESEEMYKKKLSERYGVNGK